MDISRRQLMDQLQALGQTASTETALFHQTAAARNNLHITDMKTISVLLQEGPLTAGQIAERLALTTGAVTSVINRLMSHRLVERASDPSDKRKVVVVVNQEVLNRRENMYESMGEAFEKLLSTYSTKELEFLVRYHQATIDMTKQKIAKLSR